MINRSLVLVLVLVLVLGGCVFFTGTPPCGTQCPEDACYRDGRCRADAQEEKGADSPDEGEGEGEECAPGSTVDLCNGVDDDCDRQSVDGSEDPLVGTACDGADDDVCNEGTLACSAGTLVCSDTTGSTSGDCVITPQQLVVSSFATPAGSIWALAWGDDSLWLADENLTIYRLSADGVVQASFSTTYYASDLAWFEDALWLHDGSRVYQLDSASGETLETLEVGYWSNSGMEWAEGDLYVGDYNFSTIHKHNRSSAHILSWDTTFFGHPEAMAYDGASLWIADSCEGGNGLWQYSLLGQTGGSVDLNSVEACDFTSGRALAWDGRYLWYAGKFTVYQLDIQ